MFILLTDLHARDVVVEAAHLVARLGGRVAQELGDLAAVSRVLVDAQLEVLGEGLIELLVLLLVLGDLGEQGDALLDQVALDDAQDLVLLEALAGDVQGQVLRVDHTLHELEPARVAQHTQ